MAGRQDRGGDMGEEEKFRCLCQQYSGLMHQVAYGILRNKEDAEDAVQEALIHVVQNLSKISDPFCPETKNFLVIICKNVSINAWNKRNRVKQVELSDTLPDERAWAEPEGAGSGNETIRIVREEILGLPEAYRDCMYLELILEMDFREIAQTLGRKPETVRKQLRRGKKLLRERLRERGANYED